MKSRPWSYLSSLGKKDRCTATREQGARAHTQQPGRRAGDFQESTSSHLTPPRTEVGHCTLFSQLST